MSNISEMMNGIPKWFHFKPVNFPPTVLSSSPCVEFATFYGVDDKFMSRTEKFLASIGSVDVDGYLENTFGPVIEEIAKDDGSGKGKAIVVLIGWESKEKHMAFRETQTFKDNIPLLREGVAAAEVFHVEFKTFE
jgi:hypothetical protein